MREASLAPMVQTTRIAKYTCHLFSSRDDDAVVIFLFDDRSDRIGEVSFVGDDMPLPPTQDSGPRVHLYFRRSQFRDVMDLLRNEGPIYLRHAGPVDSALSTEFEPVGEGEPRGRR